ncbi:MAG: TPM domain-containing protein [Candidatus Sphingomonas phytovorans]|nr:TPM domain-containing protein [Sphingomonas sp.]WEJ98554.1 MAG: TPM domain-containing protein [Sphingomonas sp.]
MARTAHLNAEGRALVAAAVTRAEQGTDGEIVTIVSQRSDQYHDAALHYAFAAALAVIALAAMSPATFEAKFGWFSNGWGEASSRTILFSVLIAETIIFLIVRYTLAWAPLRMALTPRGTRSRRVRRRAIQYFKVGAERRTEARVGILLYLSLDERIAEIVADEAIHKAVPAERWGEAMTALVDEVRAGRPAEGMAAAVTRIGAILSENFPKTETDRNELPDRLIQL